MLYHVIQKRLSKRAGQAGYPPVRVPCPHGRETSPMQQPNKARSWQMAVQEVESRSGRCHRQALWCGTHFSAWPSGQRPGCNDFTADVQRVEASLLASLRPR